MGGIPIAACLVYIWYNEKQEVRQWHNERTKSRLIPKQNEHKQQKRIRRQRQGLLHENLVTKKYINNAIKL